MRQYRITRVAEGDLEQIFDYISLDNLEAARTHHARFIKLFRLIAENPNIGMLKPTFGKNIRMTPMGSYLIFHRLKENNIVEITRVLHAARNINKGLIN